MQLRFRETLDVHSRKVKPSAERKNIALAQFLKHLGQRQAKQFRFLQLVVSSNGDFCGVPREKAAPRRSENYEKHIRGAVESGASLVD